MQDRELNCAIFRVANPGDMSGVVTADKMIVGLRNAKGRILRRLARYGVFGAAVAVLPLQQAILVYDDPTHLHGPLALALASNGDDGVRGRFFGLVHRLQ